MTKEEALYQVKLILDNLSDEEFAKVPKEDLDYIQKNMKVNPKIKINPEIPLEEQNIDSKAFDVLEKIINKIEKNEAKIKEQEKIVKAYDKFERIDLINQIENYKKEISKLKEEVSKVDKAKALIESYKNTLEVQQEEIDKLKIANNDLYENIQNCPRVIKKLFFKDYERKLLK